MHVFRDDRLCRKTKVVATNCTFLYVASHWDSRYTCVGLTFHGHVGFRHPRRNIPWLMLKITHLFTTATRKCTQNNNRNKETYRLELPRSIRLVHTMNLPFRLGKFP